MQNDLLHGDVLDPSAADQSSSGQIGDFSRNGFIVFKRFLAAQKVLALVRAVESLDNDSRSSRLRRGITFARRNLLELEFVRALCAESSVRELVDRFAPGLTPVRAILFDKSGAANWTVPWHQDRSIAVQEKIDAAGYGPWSIKAGVVHVQPPSGVLQRMLTLRFHLDACGSDNGPLRVIAATHDHVLNPSEVENIVVANQPTMCLTEAGGLVVMRPLLLHSSATAKIVSHRRVIHVEYGPPDLPGGLRRADQVEHVMPQI